MRMLRRNTTSLHNYTFATQTRQTSLYRDPLHLRAHTLNNLLRGTSRTFVGKHSSLVLARIKKDITHIDESPPASPPLKVGTKGAPIPPFSSSTQSTSLNHSSSLTLPLSLPLPYRLVKSGVIHRCKSWIVRSLKSGGG
jgi:hypothetical protein